MLLLVDGLAAYRLTRLVTADVITAGRRDWFISEAYSRAGAGTHDVLTAAEQWGWTEAAMQDDDPPKLATLVTCRFCAGVWVAAGVVLARRVIPRQWAPIADMLAIAAAAALIAGLEDD